MATSVGVAFRTPSVDRQNKIFGALENMLGVRSRQRSTPLLRNGTVTVAAALSRRSGAVLLACRDARLVWETKTKKTT